MSLDDFAKSLSMFSVDRPVVNHTGIAGTFDFHLEYAVDETDAFGLPIAAALQQQLGLRLEAASGPRELLIIEHVERPSGN